MDDNLKHLISIRNELLSKWLRNKRSAEARADYVRARMATQSALRAAKDSWMWRLGNGPGGSNNLWSYVNSKSKAPLNTASFEVSGKFTSEPQVVANAFAECFKKNFQRVLDFYPYRVSGCRGGSAAGDTPELRQ
jgi:hypothetical protein